MPRKRPLHRYPKEYYELFERAQNAPFDLSFEDHARARYVRMDLYALRAEVRRMVTLDQDNDELNAQYVLMENIVIEMNDNVLHFRARRYKNQNHISTALHEAFQGAPHATQEPPSGTGEQASPTDSDVGNGRET